MSENNVFVSYLQQIGNEKLKPIIQKALQKHIVNLRDWTYKPLLDSAGGGIFNSAIYRFIGTCEISGDVSISWSLILKIIRKQDDKLPSSSHYWRREFDAYQSGWLNNLPTQTFAAPRCYATEIFEGTLACLWLEDLQDSDAQWNRHSLGIAAGHLGQFNGHYLVQEDLPNYPWFSKSWIRGDVDTAAQFLPQLEHVQDNPYLAPLMTEARKVQCRKIYDERDTFFNALDKLPKTIQHLDAFSRNLFLSKTNGQQKTVAIDWAFVGLEAVGAELVSLFWVTLLFKGCSAPLNLDRELKEVNCIQEGVYDEQAKTT